MFYYRFSLFPSTFDIHYHVLFLCIKLKLFDDCIYDFVPFISNVFRTVMEVMHDLMDCWVINIYKALVKQNITIATQIY